jgi:hypothetical protein
MATGGHAETEHPDPRAASKSSCGHLSCVNAAEAELRRGVDMAVLSGASNRQVTLTWAEGRC